MDIILKISINKIIIILLIIIIILKMKQIKLILQQLMQLKIKNYNNCNKKIFEY